MDEPIRFCGSKVKVTGAQQAVEVAKAALSTVVEVHLALCCSIVASDQASSQNK